MKKIVLIMMLIFVLTVFGGCSGGEIPEVLPPQDENDFSLSEPEAEKPFSPSGTAVAANEIWPEDNGIKYDYAYDSLDYAKKWKEIIFSPDIAAVKAADAFDEINFGPLPEGEALEILLWLDSFEPGTFDINSELNPPTGGGLYFGAYDSEGKEIWRVAYNGAWLCIYISGENEGYKYEILGGEKNEHDFSFVKTAEYVPFDISSADPLLLKYYEFFGPELGYLGDYYDGNGFAPKAMAMYIFDGFVDPEAEKYGISKDEFIRISENCFGLNVLELTDFYVDDGTGYIVPADGYSPSPTAFVLKERTENPDGSVTAVFYHLGWDFETSYPAPLDNILLSGQFGLLTDTVGLKEYRFFERTDENGNFYAEFISAKILEPVSVEGIYPVYGS